MAQVLITESSLQDIADAIREKNELITTYKPSEMGDAIRAMSSGLKTASGSLSISTKLYYNGYTYNYGIVTGLDFKVRTVFFNDYESMVGIRVCAYMLDDDGNIAVSTQGQGYLSTSSNINGAITSLLSKAGENGLVVIGYSTSGDYSVSAKTMYWRAWGL